MRIHILNNHYLNSSLIVNLNIQDTARWAFYPKRDPKDIVVNVKPSQKTTPPSLCTWQLSLLTRLVWHISCVTSTSWAPSWTRRRPSRPSQFLKRHQWLSLVSSATLRHQRVYAHSRPYLPSTWARTVADASTRIGKVFFFQLCRKFPILISY